MLRYVKSPLPREDDDDRAVRETVSLVLDRVRREGEAAVRHFSRHWDNWDPPSLRISEEEIWSARNGCSAVFLDDLAYCQRQVREFARRQLETMQELEYEPMPGVVLGHRHIPVASAGSYVPGGRYPLVASAHMSIITPKVAGVARVVACTPPAADARPYLATLVAMAEAGADEIYCMGGVQALAAMAFGCGEMQPVDMLVGPGNRFVAEAKRQLFGVVGIDLLAGPTEILIIADGTADAHMVAADLLGQSEHGPDSPAVLVTTDAGLAEAVLNEVADQLRTLPTKEVAGVAWESRGAIIVAESDEEAARAAEEFAPEHLEVQTANPEWYFRRLHNYGTIFLGEAATVAFSDKAIGPNHILPTGRAARFTGGLWVGKFLKTVTFQKLTRSASLAVAPVVARQCRVEGMLAHELTALKRLDKYGSVDVPGKGTGVEHE